MNINNDIEKVLIKAEDLDAKIMELAHQLEEDYQDKKPIAICLLKGSVHFFSEVCKYMSIPMEYDFLRASSYSGTHSGGKINVTHKPLANLEKRHLLLFEDIIDTGLTLSTIVKLLREEKPASIEIVTLLDKPEMRKVKDVVPKYTGFYIPNKFVVGFGLDYNDLYRNLPYIGVLKPAIYEK